MTIKTIWLLFGVLSTASHLAQPRTRVAERGRALRVQRLRELVPRRHTLRAQRKHDRAARGKAQKGDAVVGREVLIKDAQHVFDRALDAAAGHGACEERRDGMVWSDESSPSGTFKIRMVEISAVHIWIQ